MLCGGREFPTNYWKLIPAQGLFLIFILQMIEELGVINLVHGTAIDPAMSLIDLHRSEEVE